MPRRISRTANPWMPRSEWIVVADEAVELRDAIVQRTRGGTERCHQMLGWPSYGVEEHHGFTPPPGLCEELTEYEILLRSTAPIVKCSSRGWSLLDVARVASAVQKNRNPRDGRHGCGIFALEVP